MLFWYSDGYPKHSSFYISLSPLSIPLLWQNRLHTHPLGILTALPPLPFPPGMKGLMFCIRRPGVYGLTLSDRAAIDRPFKTGTSMPCSWAIRCGLTQGCLYLGIEWCPSGDRRSRQTHIINSNLFVFIFLVLARPCAVLESALFPVSVLSTPPNSTFMPKGLIYVSSGNYTLFLFSSRNEADVPTRHEDLTPYSRGCHVISSVSLSTPFLPFLR